MNSVDNPANATSCNISARKLVSLDLWWHGQKRLRDHASGWLRSTEFCSFKGRVTRWRTICCSRRLSQQRSRRHELRRCRRWVTAHVFSWVLFPTCRRVRSRADLYLVEFQPSRLHHLQRIVEESIMTFEEFTTLLCQVEACLNSRPLVPLTEDASNLLVLTPAHFLIGKPFILITETRITDETVTPLQRWRRMQQLTQKFSDCWSSDYLWQVKWKKTSTSIKAVDIVLIGREAAAPTRCVQR